MGLFDILGDAKSTRDKIRNNRLAINAAKAERATDELYNPMAGALEDTSLDFLIPPAGKALSGNMKLASDAAKQNRGESVILSPLTTMTDFNRQKMSDGIDGILGKNTVAGYDRASDSIYSRVPFDELRQYPILRHEQKHGRNYKSGENSGYDDSSFSKYVTSDDEITARIAESDARLAARDIARMRGEEKLYNQITEDIISETGTNRRAIFEEFNAKGIPASKNVAEYKRKHVNGPFYNHPKYTPPTMFEQLLTSDGAF